MPSSFLLLFCSTRFKTIKSLFSSQSSTLGRDLDQPTRLSSFYELTLRDTMQQISPGKSIQLQNPFASHKTQRHAFQNYNNICYTAPQSQQSSATDISGIIKMSRSISVQNSKMTRSQTICTGTDNS